MATDSDFSYINAGHLNGGRVAAGGSLRCRQILPNDLPGVAALLHEGFPSKSAACFLRALERLAEYRQPDKVPQFGYLLDTGQDFVGVILTIGACVPGAGVHAVRCNLACWHSDARFRAYAPLLILRALRRQDMTFINISPAPQTLPTIVAQGFRRFSAGSFAALAGLDFRWHGARAAAFSPHTAPILPADEQAMLRDHAAYGCLCVVVTRGDDSRPFIFRRRSFNRLKIPCAQLIYCRDMEDFRRFAGLLGRYLARRGLPWLLVGGDGPVSGVPGWYFAGKSPMYYRGGDPPRLGDLAYTEAALFGF